VARGVVGSTGVARHVYDLILIDMDMPVMNGFTAVQEMRRRGYSGRIVAATGLTEPGAQERCLAAGCDEYIPKPYARADLAVLLESLRQEPLLSTFRDDASMKDLVQTFVAELPVRVRAVEECVVQQDLKRLQHLARCLKGEGSGYGFDVITEAAGKLETAIIAGTQLTAIQNEINALVKLCMQACSAAQTPRPRDDQPGPTRT
jgi:CheY-like chemotaxis protein